jgi:hypothetical protein
MNKPRATHKGPRNPNKGYPRWAREEHRRPSEEIIPNIAAHETESVSEHRLTGELGANAPSKNPPADHNKATILPISDTSAGEAMESEGQRRLSTVDIKEDSSRSLDSDRPTAVPTHAVPDATSSPDKREKRPEPQNVSEFIAAFFEGRTKSLSNATLKRLINTSLVVEPAERGALLRKAQETDKSLDRTRNLMLLAKDIRGQKSLSYQLLEFCFECVLLNPSVRSNGMRAMLFPGFEDESSLEDAWRELQLLSMSEQANSDRQSSVRAATDDTGPDDANHTMFEVPSTARQQKIGKEKAVGSKVATNRSRRNALLCSAIWRMHHGETTFGETMRSLRATIFALSERPVSLDTKVFEAVATLPEKEDERLAYVLEWSARQQAEGQNKLVDALRQLESSYSRISTMEEQLKMTLERADGLERQLGSERAARAASDQAVSVAQTHGQADLEEIRALSLIAIRDAIAQLDVVSVALSRELPKIDSARDKVHSVMDALKNTNTKLEKA